MNAAMKYRMHRSKMARGGRVPMCAEGCDMDHEHMYAEGDVVEPSPTPRPPVKQNKRKVQSFMHGFQDAFAGSSPAEATETVEGEEHKAHGGAIGEDDRMLNQHGDMEVGAEGMDEDNEEQPMHNYAHSVENQEEGPEADMIGHIMKKRQMHYSKGGRVANDVGTGQEAGKLPNQYDDLVLRDDLEQHYTGANSGDEIGDAQEDEDRRDIVSMVMKSRRKKDRLPNPR